MGYTKGEWKKYGQHIHINTSNTSDEIATVLWPEWMPESEARANAHLIAAAPDLYEALVRIQKIYRANGEEELFEHPREWIIVRETLAKANKIAH